MSTLFQKVSVYNDRNLDFKDTFEYYEKQLLKLLSGEEENHELSLNYDVDIGKVISNFDAYLNTRQEAQRSETHFSRALIDAFNKIMVTASENQPRLSPNCFVNNQEVYKILENCLCDYYLERLVS